MTIKRKKWLLGIGVFFGMGLIALTIAGYFLARRIDPYIRNQAIVYLQERFDSEVELTSLSIHLPRFSRLKFVFSGGRGALARVEGEGLSLRHKGRHDVPPMFAIRTFSAEVDLGTLFNTPKTVRSVTIDGMTINVPPKDESSSTPEKRESSVDLLVQEVIVANSTLSILPKDQTKTPLRFDLHRVRLESVGKGVGMKYDAALTNAKPPGEILSKGTIGPWAAEEPGDTPITGKYDFRNADLSVFAGIAGTLASTGDFDGSLSALNVHGQATVPDFNLALAGNHALRMWRSRRDDASTGDNFPISGSAPHGRIGAVRSTAAWESHDFADVIRRDGVFAPCQRANSPTICGGPGSQGRA